MSENERIETILKSGDLRVTEQRVSVLGELLNSPEPQSVASLSKSLSLIDTVTIYRTLDAFVTAGIARRVDVGHNHAHFEVAHVHRDTIQCRKCGIREEVDSCAIGKRESREVERTLSNFSSIEDHVIQFISICNTCKQ